MIYVSFCPIISGERTISSYIQDYRKSRSFATYNEVRYNVCWSAICMCFSICGETIKLSYFYRVLFVWLLHLFTSCLQFTLKSILYCIVCYISGTRRRHHRWNAAPEEFECGLISWLTLALQNNSTQHYTYNKLTCVKKACFMCLFNAIWKGKLSLFWSVKCILRGKGELVCAIILYRVILVEEGGVDIIWYCYCIYSVRY
jgi:hypothetical protein